MKRQLCKGAMEQRPVCRVGHSTHTHTHTHRRPCPQAAVFTCSCIGHGSIRTAAKRSAQVKLVDRRTNEVPAPDTRSVQRAGALLTPVGHLFQHSLGSHYTCARLTKHRDSLWKSNLSPLHFTSRDTYTGPNLPLFLHAARGLTRHLWVSKYRLTVLFLDTILSSFFAIRMRSSSRVIAAFTRLRANR